MPYKVALIDDDNDFFFIMDTIVDFLFIIDVIINLNSPIETKQGVYNFHRKTVFLNYLKSWLLVDIVASIPMNLI